MEVIVLAGGLGTRLRSVVADTPKCMAPIAGGKPFLWYIFKYLSRYQVTRVILSVGYLREQVMDWVETQRARWPFEVVFAIEEEPLGTGGGIKNACALAADRHVAVLNGDTLFDLDLDNMMAYHQQQGGSITLALREMTEFDRYGTVTVKDDGVVTGFEERKYCERGLINGGVYMLDREAPGIWPSSGESKFSFESAVLGPQCLSWTLQSIESDGYFIDIGVPQDYKRACIDLPELFPERLSDVRVSAYDYIILDRDGVINQLRPHDYVKKWSEFKFMPGVLETIARWTEWGKDIYIITNQRGVGRGVMTGEALVDINERMISAIESMGGEIKGMYICTAVADDDHRRKPQTGMWEELLRDHPEVEPSECLMIGDSSSDMQFAAACGIKGVRL